MMTIRQTVTVPADRRIYFDLPENTPAGTVKAKLTLKTAKANAPASAAAPSQRPGFLEWVLHPIRSYRGASWHKLYTWLKEERSKHGPLFGGSDGLAYQRTLRDEWENRP